jgi:hypothetical protein
MYVLRHGELAAAELSPARARRSAGCPRRAVDAGDEVEQRRLAAAGRAHQCQELALPRRPDPDRERRDRRLALLVRPRQLTAFNQCHDLSPCAARAALEQLNFQQHGCARRLRDRRGDRQSRDRPVAGRRARQSNRPSPLALCKRVLLNVRLVHDPRHGPAERPAPAARRRSTSAGCPTPTPRRVDQRHIDPRPASSLRVIQPYDLRRVRVVHRSSMTFEPGSTRRAITIPWHRRLAPPFAPSAAPPRRDVPAPKPRPPRARCHRRLGFGQRPCIRDPQFQILAGPRRPRLRAPRICAFENRLVSCRTDSTLANAPPGAPARALHRTRYRSPAPRACSGCDAARTPPRDMHASAPSRLLKLGRASASSSARFSASVVPAAVCQRPAQLDRVIPVAAAPPPVPPAAAVSSSPAARPAPPPHDRVRSARHPPRAARPPVPCSTLLALEHEHLFDDAIRQRRGGG